MTTMRRAAVTFTGTGVALGLLAGPAVACPDGRTIKAEGPTHTYDEAYKNARTAVRVRTEHGRTIVGLKVRGMPEAARGKTLGVHVHENECGPEPADAGPHYQRPGAEPGTPLRKKEVWLDVRVDAQGRGASKAVVPWKIAKGAAGSVVVHAGPTDPKTGEAGPRTLCTTVPFGT